MRASVPLIAALFLICSSIITTATAEEKKIDSFEGLQSKKKDGVLVIDIAPGASRSKMHREAARSGRKAKRQWAKVHVDQAIDRAREARKEAIRAFEKKYRSSSPSRSYSSSPDKSKYKSSQDFYKSFYKKRLREVQAEERNHVGGYTSRQKRRWEENKEYYKNKIQDVDDHPEDY